MSNRKKIAIVNQRYGKEVNGGSEYFTMLLAEHLADTCDVEIITTCARDYDTWENYYQPGIQTSHARKSVLPNVKKCGYIFRL